MSAQAADRNLLFGILALQMDFIDREELVGALNAWALEKNRSLGRLLVERGAMTEAELALLEPLVARHVEKHGGDPEKSLAAIEASPSTRDALAHLPDMDVQASLLHVASRPVEDDPFATQSHVGAADPAGTRLLVQLSGQSADDDPFATQSQVGAPTSAGRRFRILRFHAKGGLGVVSVALDAELDRQVALKEIQGERADHPESRSRFVQEAEITGKLEHPGIVPVYGLGAYEDGRPFYAMRFIRGDSLQDAIRRFHQADADPKRDPGERAVQLRDLLGRFLDVCDAIAYAHSRGVLHRDLKPGNVMLGPFGETLVVDWGLAKPLGQAEETNGAPLEPVRLSGSISGSRDETVGAVGTPAYMSPEQAEGRLDQLGPASDVFSLGATLYHLLTGQSPYTADGTPILPRVIRGDFPAPRLVKPSVSRAIEAICLKAMALRPEDRYASPRELAADLKCWLADEPVSAWREPWRVRARRWVSRHRTPVAAALAAFVIAMLVGGGGWILYQRSERGRLDGVAREVRAALNEAQLAVGGARASTDLARWSEAVSASRRARSLLASGGGDEALSKEVALVASRIESDASAARLAAEATTRNRRMVADLDEARLLKANVKDGHFDHDAMIAAFRRAFRGFGLDVEALSEREATVLVRKSPIRQALAAALDDWAPYADANTSAKLRAIARAADPDRWRNELRDAVARHDRDALRRMAGDADLARLPAATIHSLGLALSDAGLMDETVAVLRAGRKRFPGDFWINHNLGVACGAAKPPRREEAIRYLTAATALRPGSPGARLNLGNALNASGLADQAIDEFRSAIDLRPNDAEAHYNLGSTLSAQGKLGEAIGEFRRAIEIDPEDASAHNNLGAALDESGRPDEAVAEFHRAIELNPTYAVAHNNLGTALKEQGKLDEAIAEFRRAIELDPGDAGAHYNLGNMMYVQGLIDEAIPEYRQAIAIQPNDASSHNNLASALLAKGLIDEAVAEYRQTLAIDPEHARAHDNLCIVLIAQGKLEEAIAELRRVVSLHPDDPAAHTRLGQALQQHGQLDAAIAEFRLALSLHPDDPEVQAQLAAALKARDLPNPMAAPEAEPGSSAPESE